METSASFERLHQLAEQQYGVFTVQQAATVGVDEGTLEALKAEGQLRRLVEGAYKIRGFDGEHGEAYALWLLLDAAVPSHLRIPPQCGVLSHGSAADWLDSFEFDGAEITVTFPVGVRPSSSLGLNTQRVRIHQAELPAEDWFVHRGVPVTDPARMVMDLLDADDEDTTAVGRRLLGLQLSGAVDFQALAERLEGYARRNDWGGGEQLVATLREAARPDNEWKLKEA